MKVIYYNGVIKYLLAFQMPPNYRPILNTSTAPSGTIWVYNGYSHFAYDKHGYPKRVQMLLVQDLHKFKGARFYSNSSFTRVHKQLA